MKRRERVLAASRTNSELTNVKAMTRGQWSLGTLSLGADGASGLNLWNGTSCKREQHGVNNIFSGVNAEKN